MFREQEEGRIEELKRELYRRRKKPFVLPRSRFFKPPAAPPPADWPPAPPAKRVSAGRVLKLVFWTSLIFFLGAAALAGAVFYLGLNRVSAGNVDLTISGPTQIRSGEEAVFELTVVNRNEAPLQFVDLIVHYPPGARSVQNRFEELSRERLSLGTLQPGELAVRSIRAVLFGSRDSQLEFNVSVEYRLEDSNAIFDRPGSYQVVVSASPVEIAFNLPPEVDSGQDLAVELEITSNADTPLENLILALQYPAGFRFKEASLPPALGEDLWRLAELSPGRAINLQIVGSLEGQTDEQKFFKAVLGVPSEGDPGRISAIYASQEQIISIKRPFLALTAVLNGDALSEYAATSREVLVVEIHWQNNLSAKVVDGEIVLTFSGSALDPTSVEAERGFYRSSGNSVVWTKTSEPALAVLDPGETGRSVVKFSPLSLIHLEGAYLRDPVINLKIAFRGRREAAGGALTLVETEIAKKIKIHSVVQLAGKVLYRSGPFQNRGPLPPKVGQETTYTVIWSVVNSSNEVSDALVIAELPPYLNWLGVSSPPYETLRFASRPTGGGELVWDLGQLRGGTGFATPPREVVFQVGLIPSLSQVGTAPALVREAIFTGFDTFTKGHLRQSLSRPLDIYLVADPQFQYGEDKVIP